ncbi:MAG: helix-turn-helix domain-containing protein, partial [Rhodoferax sp.]
SSSPVALHPASRRRSYFQLRGLGLPRHGLSPCKCGAFAGAHAHGQLARLPSAQDDDLSARILDSGSSLEDIEARVLDHAVARANGNLSEAARLLGLTRPQLAYRQKRRHTGPADTSSPPDGPRQGSVS